RPAVEKQWKSGDSTDMHLKDRPRLLAQMNHRMKSSGKEIQSHSEHPSEETLETIPVAVEALTVIVHLPAGCTATSNPFPGRLVLSNRKLEKIFRGIITKWSEITESGDKLEGASCTPASSITRIVRREQAGTTSILKKYLSEINGAGLEVEVEGKKEEKTWKQ